MTNEDQDPTWELLGRARPVAVSPYFARRVVNAVRDGGSARSGVLVWLRRWWQPLALGATALVALSAQPVWQSVHDERELLAVVDGFAASPDFEVVGNLDELIASEEDALWLEGTL